MVRPLNDKVILVVRAGESSDVICNWNGKSQLQLWGYGFATADQIRAAITQQGSDVVQRFNNGETLTIRDETLASFQGGQFLLPLDLAKLGAVTFWTSSIASTSTTRRCRRACSAPTSAPI